MTDIEGRQRTRRIVTRHRLSALANDTKWREFFTEMVRLCIPMEFKIINEDDIYKCHQAWLPATNYIEGTSMGPYLFAYIEWVRSNAVDKVSLAAGSVGLDYVVENGTATVFGYKWRA